LSLADDQGVTHPDSSAALSHLDDDGAARMVDVTDKSQTARRAIARGTLHTTAEVLGLITVGVLPKGDALATARVAGILAAKHTSDLIPLCHQIALSSVDIDFESASAAIEITASVRTTDRTGVEMEALTAVTVAALALYDMIKALDPAARIDDIRVLRKEGGKTGLWTYP
jgi:cyclic pyranopterin phosphate synthase